ncbi:MAG: efflux RND transporter periplasmic adaptor subunit [Cyclobacteriaceae bacterium]|nr:efflux RND transporter periplasmic adaptor subunit [Cyclobacteriaceae bacterium]
MTRSYPILFLVLLLLACADEKKYEDNGVAFSISDTMLANCEFYEASEQPVKNDIRLFGKITVDNNKMARVNSIVGGHVLTVNAELGDYVKQGQVLATVRSSEVAEFQRQLLDAQSDVAVAEKNLQVTKELFEGKLNAERDVNAAEKELVKAKAELARINEVYAIYKLSDGSTYNILAPISGFVLEKDIFPNEQLRGDVSEALFSISEINEVWALANVSESDISKIQLGYDAEVRTLGFPDKVYKGKIDKIFNTIDPETKAMKVRVRIPNESFQLKPEMMATVNVIFTENKKLVAVPSSSIIFDKSKNWVMVFKDRQNIETRNVEVYRQLGDITYLSEGLQQGEKVISKNGLFVYDAIND